MPLATVAILSIGDMGVGIAKLLIAHDYRVITNASDRSPATQDRAQRNGVELIATDNELCEIADYILSIVPPRDAFATAKRIATVTSSPDLKRKTSSEQPLYFLDLNAISPSLAREINSLFPSPSESHSTPHSAVRYIDGGILGPPPSPPSSPTATWTKPSIPVSGPHTLASAPKSGSHLAAILNIKHINTSIGSATGLKQCFASLHKGFAALAIQSYTTAHALGVLPELQTQLGLTSPGVKERAEKGLISMPPKAYRWVDEMRQIGWTFEVEGGFGEGMNVFEGIGDLYALVAEGTILGDEKTEGRVRGRTAEDVAVCVAEGIERRRRGGGKDDVK